MPDINLLPSDLPNQGSEDNKKTVKTTAQPGPKMAEPAVSRQRRPSQPESRPVRRTEPKKATKVDGSSGFGVNLIKEQEAEVEGRQARMSRLILGGVLILLELALIGGGYAFFNQYLGQKQATIDSAQADIDGIKKEIDVYAPDTRAAMAVQTKLEALKTIFGQHIYWTLFFKSLEANTVPDIFYNTAAADGTRVSLQGRAPSFDSLAKQLLIFQNLKDSIAQVSVSNVSLIEQDNQTQLLFNFDMIVNPKLIIPGTNASQ